MNKILRKWIIDSVSIDMQRTYKVNMPVPQNVDFINRHSDYYVNLITRMLNVLNNEDNKFSERTRHAELLAIAHGMEIFNASANSINFNGVNQNENTLYVAALYYMCDFTAVAALMLKECDPYALKTNAAKKIYYIVSGGRFNDNNYDCGINEYFITGDDTILNELINSLTYQKDKLSYDNVDDFFDSQLLLQILNKFKNNNLRHDIYEHNPHINWERYLEYALSQSILTLLPSQRDAIQKGLLTYSRSFALQMPTSAGKSFLTELLIYQELQSHQNAKILYLAPLRSLSRELKGKYAKISRELGFSYRCIYGGSSISVTEEYMANADMLITTPETFMTLEGSMENILQMFSLVICDEGQLLESAHRGLDYELLLSRLKKQQDLRFLFISAILPNIGEINTWLGGNITDVCNSTFRPCSIRFADASISNKTINLSIFENLNKPSLFSIDNYVSKDECKGINLNTKKNIASLIALKSLKAGSVMLYTSFKKGPSGCEGYGHAVLEIINRNVISNPRSFLDERACSRLGWIEDYIVYQYGEEYFLSKFIKSGFAIHHASLPQDIREVIEIGYSQGYIRLLICNSTLAEGVNFPIKTLVLGDIRHPVINGRLMEKETLLNVIGRTGRAGKQTYGLVISSSERFNYVKEAALGDGLKPAKGMLNEIVEYISNYENTLRRKLTEEEINQLLEKLNLTESIDRSIFLSEDEFSFENIDVNDIYTTSLSYHLASQDKKDNLKRLFTIRYNHLRQMGNDDLVAYKETGFNSETLSILKDSMHNGDDFSNVTETEFCNSEWLKKLIEHTGKVIQIDNYDKIINIILLWQSGQRYIDIANILSVNIDEIAEKIEWLTKDFLRASKKIIKYICTRFDIDNEAFTYWPMFIEKGLNSKLQCQLLKKGLSDRISIHCVESYIMKHISAPLDIDIILMILKKNKDNIRRYSNKKGIPYISKKRIMQFIDAIE